jgi:hypothetical protein
MRGPDWSPFDVINFTLFLLVLFVGVPVAIGKVSVVLGVVLFVVEVVIVAIYEFGLVERYRAALRDLVPGDYSDEWERENID